MSNLLKPEVDKFLNKCSHDVGVCEEETFRIELWQRFNDDICESPIEQFLYIALNAVMKFNLIEESEPGLCHYCPLTKDPNRKYILSEGITIIPQYKIGNYRVDLFVSYTDCRFIENKVIVECDSQQWHERTEKERRYEKRRDRYLQKLGYRVFHYTGKEIMENPLNIAGEIIAFLTKTNIKNVIINLEEENKEDE